MKRVDDSATPKHTNAISRQLQDELIVYDLGTDRAHSLNHTAGEVWKLCDGKTTVPEMVARLDPMLPGIDNQVLLATLVELQKAGLLEKTSFSLSQDSSRSRRDILRKIGKLAVVAVPVVTSIAVPTPAMAASCFQVGHTCNTNGQCCPPLRCLLGVCA
jgi:Coenzyme PQQ synthesis protein D (PqqD)